MKQLKLTATLCIVLFTTMFISGCKKDNYVPLVGVCPAVISTDPANAETNVALNKVITVTFNGVMDPKTINEESFTIVGPTKIEGKVSYNDTGVVMSFTPNTALATNTTYTGRVKSSVKDPMGNALQQDYVWSFSTGSTVSPRVIATDPISNETGVFLNKIITADFSMAMDPLTINGTTFTIKQNGTAIAGTVSYVDSTATFQPAAALTPNTTYTGTITTGAKNTSGVAIPANYTWTFITGAISAPMVISTDPANNATGVPINKVITATFSEVMNPLTINNTTFMVKQGSNVVAGVVTYNGSTATFTPSGQLLSGVIYTATITTGAKNPAGTPMANNYVWNFSTGAPSGAQGVDLKTVERFGIIAGVGISNNAGFSIIRNMDVGISPGVRSSITGFPPATVVNGAIYASDDVAPAGVAAMLTQAKQDLTDAYLFAEGATSPAAVIVSGDQGGKTLAPGIYKSTSTLLIQSGNLTLDAQGDANAVWIFQIASDFTTIGGAGGNVILTGGAQAKNVFWQTGSSATIGDFTSFKGNVLALTSITMNSGATAVGRMLARNGSVVMTNTNIIDKP